MPLLPDDGGGIECPSSILLAGADRLVLVHDVAHVWDESATRSSATRGWTRPSPPTPSRSSSRCPGTRRRRCWTPPARSARRWTRSIPRGLLPPGVRQGRTALLAARESAGAEAFDAALRCYVDADADAWTIATPDDVARALQDLPAALDVVTEAGALDE